MFVPREFIRQTIKVIKLGLAPPSDLNSGDCELLGFQSSSREDSSILSSSNFSFIPVRSILFHLVQI